MVHLLHRGAGVQRPALAPQKLRNHLDYVGRLINSPQKYLSEPSTALPGRAPHHTSAHTPVTGFLAFLSRTEWAVQEPFQLGTGEAGTLPSTQPFRSPVSMPLVLLFLLPQFCRAEGTFLAQEGDGSLSSWGWGATHGAASHGVAALGKPGLNWEFHDISMWEVNNGQGPRKGVESLQPALNGCETLQDVLF